MFSTKQAFAISIKILTCCTALFKGDKTKNLWCYFANVFPDFSLCLNFANENFRDISCWLNFKDGNFCEFQVDFISQKLISLGKMVWRTRFISTFKYVQKIYIYITWSKHLHRYSRLLQNIEAVVQMCPIKMC